MSGQGAVEREALRVLRFLAKGSACVREAAGAGRMLLEGEDRGAVGAQVAVLERLGRDGLVERARGRLRLTATGQMAARRANAPADPFQAQHQERAEAAVPTPGGHETVIVNHAESPLALLWRRKTRDGKRFLTPDEFRAGERLRADYSRGCIMPRTGVNWSAAGGGGRRLGEANGIADLTDAALAARLRVEKAIAAVGPELAGVLIDVCCFLKGLEQVEVERGWPARSAKVVLKSALGALGRHYEPGQQGGRRPPILHWGAQDYRPRIG